MFHLSLIEGMAVGFVVGAFTPAVLRQIKALWVKWTQKLEADVKADVAKKL